LNILPDGTKASNVAQAAKKAGLSVGIVSTARLTDATPAAVYSSSPRRDCEAYIAEQLPDFAPDAILGGGRGVHETTTRFYLHSTAPGHCW
jgi:alkaline phosphatase